MYPSNFEYERADTVQDALDLMDEYADVDAELLAGGHSLLPMLKSGLATPDVLIDIGDVDEMNGISVADDTVEIGAMTPYSTVEEADAVSEHAPTFAEATHHIADIQVRNRGTVGGNIAHADPASDLAGAFLAMGGTAVAQGPDGEREIGADEYFLGMYETALASDEILTRIEVPSLGADGIGTYAKKPSPASGYPIVGIAVALRTDGETIESARVAANNVMDHAVRLEPTEDALEGESLDDVSAEDAAAVAADDLDEVMMMEDIEASQEYRAQLTRAYTEEALSECLETATPPAAD